MDVRRLLRSASVGVAIGALVVAAFCAGALVRGTLSPTHDMAFADAETTSVANRTAEIDGAEVGEVLVNNEVVMRLRATMGGMSPGQRAEVVAGRLLAWVNDPEAYDLSVIEFEDGTASISAGETSIVNVGPGDAEPIDSTPLDLANDWRNNIYIAMGEEPRPAETTAETSGEWTPSEPYRDKIVPVVSLLRGVRVGAARVNGPASRVRNVEAVAQLETDFRDVLEIDVYVPITTRSPGKSLDRVQGVGVTALGDLKL
ncbi:MAG: hypothetical protein J7M38_03230 [Armatimonadetes bacterium]|nr:hypothetical protein [Armatimonadota bacterium]